MRYREKYKRQDFAFKLLDFILMCLLVKSRASPYSRDKIKSILIANAGHLGDVIISTEVVSVIRTVFPNAKIGFLTSNYAKNAIDDLVEIDWKHYLDHWYIKRNNTKNIGNAVRYYLSDLPRVIKEIKKIKYDLAIDLRAWFPNFVPLLWLCGIPIRVGSSRVGFGPTLTHPQKFIYDRRSEIEHELDLLRILDIPETAIAGARPLIATPPDDVRQSVRSILGDIEVYDVLHPTSSTPARDWKIEGWISLASNLLAENVTPIITGAGSRDAEIAEKIAVAVPGCINTVNKLRWIELVALLAKAREIYGVNTAIGHVAAALKRPVVSLYGGMADPLRWSPKGATVVTNSLPCVPCYNKSGCAHRSCILDIDVTQLTQASREATRSATGRDRLDSP